MKHLREVWRRLGRLPAVWVLAVFSVLLILAVIVLDGSARDGLLMASAVGLVVYCIARPRGGWDVFWNAAVPGALSKLLHATVGAPRWVGLVAVPLVLWSVSDDEREERRDEVAGPDVQPPRGVVS